MPEILAESEIDPFMVASLVQAIAVALDEACIPDVTTPAEVLSAVFTMLDRLLRAMRALEQQPEHQHNAAEVSRVLTSMLMEFGSASH